jgi:hypothetical protein
MPVRQLVADQEDAVSILRALEMAALALAVFGFLAGLSAIVASFAQAT